MKLTPAFFSFLIFIAATSTVFAAPPPHATQTYPNQDFNKVLAELHKLKSEVRELKSLLIKHLQDSNQKIRQQVTHPAPPINRWSCYINTPFDGSFTATGRTKNEALGKTLGKCNHGSKNSVSCDEYKIACSAE